MPDHRITNIHGASLAGFYYVCLELSTGNIEGFYYHRLSELYVMFHSCILEWIYSIVQKKS